MKAKKITSTFALNASKGISVFNFTLKKDGGLSVTPATLQ
jgi:hypothetical protein